MKYLVEIEYKLKRTLNIYAHNPKAAMEKATRVVSEWKGAYAITPIKATEAKEDAE